MIDILIPTCRGRMDLAQMVRAIAATTSQNYRLTISASRESASVNRNRCLDKATAEFCIMLDDDIEGLYLDWDMDLLMPLYRDDAAVIVSARLMRPDGKPAPTCSRCYDLVPELIEIQPARNCVLPTAAIAFRNVGIRFDEHFRGSGFEDGDWCFQYRARFPQCKFLQSNVCRLIHRNEMKNQRGENWRHNQEYFESKWLRQPNPA